MRTLVVDCPLVRAIPLLRQGVRQVLYFDALDRAQRISYERQPLVLPAKNQNSLASEQEIAYFLLDYQHVL